MRGTNVEGSAISESNLEQRNEIDRKKRLNKCFLLGVFVFYTAYLIFALLFKFGYISTRSKTFIWKIYFDLAHSYSLHKHLEFWGNVAIFIPFGCFFSMGNKKAWLYRILNVLIIMAFSFFIEIMQSLLNIGVGCTKDVFLNTIGGVVGIYLYKLLKVILKKKTNIIFCSVLIISTTIFTWAGVVYMGGGFR